MPTLDHYVALLRIPDSSALSGFIFREHHYPHHILGRDADCHSNALADACHGERVWFGLSSELTACEPAA